MVRKELYKAVKYQVETAYADHGMSLVELWKAVNTDDFWYRTCLQEYRERNSRRQGLAYMPSRWWEPGCEDMPKVAPKEQWLPDDVELPFM